MFRDFHIDFPNVRDYVSKLGMFSNTVSIPPSAVSISADFTAVRFIFLDKIRLMQYEKFATMRIFL